MKKIDLTNQRFGRLVVLYESAIKKQNRVTWHCVCDCGKECDITSHNLRNGNTTSCGCYQKERAAQENKKRAIDYTGQKFGKLTAISPTNKRGSDGSIIWLYKCDCGNYKEINCHEVNNGRTLSCGCLSISRGEYKIKTLLEKANIPFEQEKTFEDCICLKEKARFDFWVDDSYLIEFDGKQHFQNLDTYKGKWDISKIKERDEIKNLYCKEKKIPLIRIPYTHYDKICLEDLLLETSNYIVGD